MEPCLIDYLRDFNSKERFFLIGHAIGNPSFKLGSDFRSEVASMLNMDLPTETFCAMDYHLDWLYASLQLHLDGGVSRIYPNENNIIKAQQEDVDLLIVFKVDETFHIIIVEAKGVTGWNNHQMKSKAERLYDIFGDDGKRWENVVPHFLLISPRKPQRLNTTGWPCWMHPQGTVLTLSLPVPPGLICVTRCDQNGEGSKQGKFWTIKKR